jgi:hypothetical protein
MSQLLVFLPDKGCRCSQKTKANFEVETVPFQSIPLESIDGQALAEKHGMDAS